MSNTPLSRLLASCRALISAPSSTTTKMNHERSVTRGDRKKAFFGRIRHGSNQCDSFERSSQSKINPEAAQEAISAFIFHSSDCSKLSH